MVAQAARPNRVVGIRGANSTLPWTPTGCRPRLWPTSASAPSATGRDTADCSGDTLGYRHAAMGGHGSGPCGMMGIQMVTYATGSPSTGDARPHSTPAAGWTFGEAPSFPALAASARKWTSGVRQAVLPTVTEPALQLPGGSIPGHGPYLSATSPLLPVQSPSGCGPVRP